MRQEIIRLHKKIGTAFIYVTHDQTEAMTMADKIVVMKDGIIQQIGTPVEIYENPCNSFVAGFIGTPQMNFISGSLMKEIDNSLPDDAVIGIRPEHIHISDAGNYEMEIQNQEFNGTCWILYGCVNNTNIAVKTDNRINDTYVRVDFDKNKMHVFNENKDATE